jgi:parallel beta-helix repeat protein
MKKRMKKLIHILWLNCLSLFIMANTFYVSNNGKNTNSGNAGSPWGTIQFAAEHVNQGDTVLVLAGEYDGFYMTASGTKSNPIVFQASEGTRIIKKNPTTYDGINLEGANYVIIDGFEISNPEKTITRAGIRSVTNEGVIIRNNTISGMGRWGIFTGFSENILIENNSCSNSQDEHGIYFSNSGDNPVIKNNSCFNNNSCGIHMNGDISMGGDGIISNALIEGNIIYNNGTAGGSGINCDGVQNSVIRNNLLYNNHASGISLYKIDGAEGAKNNLVINNTIVVAPDGRWALNINSGSSGNTIFNNILFNNHSYRGAITIDEESRGNFTSNYNIVSDGFTLDDGDSKLTLAQWQASTGQDNNSFLSTPNDIFENIQGDNYRPKPGCIAIDKGTSDHAPTYDIDKNSRPSGNGIDIGAYELGGSPIIGYKTITPGNIKLFPNPASHSIQVESAAVIKKIDIIDAQGKIIKTVGPVSENKIMIALPDSSGNVLFLRIYTDHGVSITHLIRS